MNACRELQVQLQSFLTVALDGCEGSTSRPDRFAVGKELPVAIEYEMGGSQRRYGRSEERKT
jgi:hypothetical protein